MNLEIDFRSGLPIYMQVVEQIKERIASGVIAPGDQLPTVRSLALELRVNFNTIARAYRILDEVGIISTQQGRGTYVLNTPPPDVSEIIRQKAVEALTLRYMADAERLRVLPEELTQILKDQVTRKQQTGYPMNQESDNE